MFVKNLIEKYEKLSAIVPMVPLHAPVTIPWVAPPLEEDHLKLESNEQTAFLLNFISEKVAENAQVKGECHKSEVIFELFDYITRSHIFDHLSFQITLRQVIWLKLIEFENQKIKDKDAKRRVKAWIPIMRKRLFNYQ
jgi:hypothetical protein